MTQIKGNNCVCKPIYRSLQNHVIVWIGKTRSPAKGKHDLFGNCRQIVEHAAHLDTIQSARRQVFRPCKDGFVFENGRHRYKKLKMPVECSQKKLTRCTLLAS